MNPENCPIELPVVGSPSVRSDAARNRMLILGAAERLFAKNGVTCTSMDAIAAEAGVGKGTLFRRFGDRGSLVFALLDATSREFQDGFISGPPPLGPGAPPVERLTAFGEALLAHTTEHGNLLLGAASAGAPISRFDAGPYASYRTHIAMLVREAAPGLDAEYTADALLAPLRPEAVFYQLRVREMPLERLAAGWSQLARRVVER